MTLVRSYRTISPLPHHDLQKPVRWQALLAAIAPSRCARRYSFCATFRRVTPSGSYPAPRPVESGLSSDHRRHNPRRSAMTQPTLQHIVYPFLARLSLFDFSSARRPPHHVWANVPLHWALNLPLHADQLTSLPSALRQARQSGLMTGVAEATLILRPAFESALSFRNTRTVGFWSHQRSCFTRCLSPAAAVSSRIVSAERRGPIHVQYSIRNGHKAGEQSMW